MWKHDEDEVSKHENTALFGQEEELLRVYALPFLLLLFFLSTR